MKYANMQERLLAMSVAVDLGQETKCWLWCGAINKDGYARLNIRCHGRVKCLLAHRVAREVFVEPIPAKHDADHLDGCPRHCINPNHTQPVEYRMHRRKTAWPKTNPSGSIRHLP